MIRRAFISADPFLEFTGDFFYRGNWPAKWVGHPDLIGQSQCVTAYKLSFDIPVAKTVRIHVSADERYELYLDGKLVARGSERGDRLNWYYETFDIDLTAGTHLLVARTWWLGDTARDASGKVDPKGGTAPFAQFSVRPAFILASEGDAQDLLSTGIAAWQVKSLAGISFLFADYCWGTGAKVKVDGATFDWDFETGQGTDWQPADPIAAGQGPRASLDVRNQWVLHPGTLPQMYDGLAKPGRVRFVESVSTGATRDVKVDLRNHLADEQKRWENLLIGQAGVTIPARTRRRIIVDLENYVCGYPRLTLSAGKDATVGINWIEGLYENPPHPKSGAQDGAKGNRNEIDGKYFVGIGDLFVSDGSTKRTFSTLWWECGRYVEFNIETHDEPLTIDTFEIVETHYPYSWNFKFDASDPRLARVIAPAIRVLEMCSHETYMDCPYYEQLQYIGDTRLEVLATYVTTADDRLPRKAVTLFDKSRVTSGLTQSRYPSRMMQLIPPFSLWWVGMVWDAMMWRDDPAFVRKMLPGVRGVLDAFRSFVNADGMLETPLGWNFVDWVPGYVWGMPRGADVGVNATLNWHMVYTLNLAAEMETVLGDPELASKNRRIAKEMAGTIDANFWDKSRGLYVESKLQREFSEHAQCLALLGGHLPPERAPRLIEGLMDSSDLLQTTIYFSHYLFETLRLLDRTDRVIDRMSLWFDLQKIGCFTTLEHPEPSRSDCHAWGAHPLYHYFATFAGIRPASAGFQRVHIAPKLGPLTWARGSMPHPRGAIAFDLKRDGRDVTGTIELPSTLTGEYESAGRRVSLKGGMNRV